jgi:hypothetical protein
MGAHFKDPMIAMAAIDRLVHHSVILDMMSVESYRAEEASQHHLPSARPKKSSSRRGTLDETVGSLPGSDAPSAITSQSVGKLTPASLLVAESAGKLAET